MRGTRVRIDSMRELESWKLTSDGGYPVFPFPRPKGIDGLEVADVALLHHVMEVHLAPGDCGGARR